MLGVREAWVYFLKGLQVILVYNKDYQSHLKKIPLS